MGGRVSLGRALLIVNPAAKHGVTGEMIPAIRTLMDGVAEYDLVTSNEPHHAHELAREARGYDTVVAVGGDGTVHEVVCGIMERPVDDRPAMSVLPTGSGNDYARTLGIDFDLSTAVRQIVTGVRTTVDIGLCNGQHFANSLAIGLDARVTAKAVELKITTGWSGIWLYMRALFYVLFNQFYSHPVQVIIDHGEPQDMDIMIVAMTNGPTYGGGFRITPDAVGDDGLLDVCILDKIGLANALWRLPFLVFGKHTNMKPVTMMRIKSLGLVSKQPIEGQIDGETMIEDRYDVSILPGTLDVIVPKEPTNG
jgi:YegS/Rv2252/BmrU family lipid kinase